MLTHSHAAVAFDRAPPRLALQPAERPGALLDSVGVVADERSIVVLGRVGPDLMCELLRAGAPRVAHLCSHERLGAGGASLVIIPELSCLDWLERGLCAIRRSLSANGRLAVCFDPLPATQDHVRRMLVQHNFVAIRANRIASRTLLSAALP